MQKNSVSYIDAQDLQAQSRSFESIALYKMNGFTVLNEEQAERVQGMRVTANFLSVLKVHPMLGRDFQVEEEKPNSRDVVIISHQFWNNRLAGDQNTVGKQLTLDGKPFTIIGVLPSDFEFPLARQSTEVLLTVTGIYSHTREIGIRMALGAQAVHVLKLIVGKGFVLTLIGTGIGLLGAFALTHVMRTLLFGVSATDWMTFAGVAILLIAVGLLAAAIPARRATRVDPLVALRYE